MVLVTGIQLCVIFITRIFKKQRPCLYKILHTSHQNTDIQPLYWRVQFCEWQGYWLGIFWWLHRKGENYVATLLIYTSVRFVLLPWFLVVKIDTVCSKCLKDCNSSWLLLSHFIPSSSCMIIIFFVDLRNLVKALYHVKL